MRHTSRISPPDKQNTIQQQSHSPSDVCECNLSCLSNGKALQKESKGLLLYEEEKGKPTVLSSRTNSSTSYSSLGSVCMCERRERWPQLPPARQGNGNYLSLPMPPCTCERLCVNCPNPNGSLIGLASCHFSMQFTPQFMG